jgi:hypothetical protein
VKTGLPDVDWALSMLVPGMRAALGEVVLGAYVFGSVAHDEYDAGVSDLDVLAVVDRPLEPADLPALERMHAATARVLPEWDDRVEVLYVSTEALRTFREKSAPIAVISPGESLNIKLAGREWLMNWWDVRENGIRLFGPPASAFIAPISRAEFVGSIRSYAEEFPSRLDESDTEKWHAYITLTMCRSMYTVAQRETVSKRRAAEWAAGAWPEWAGHLLAALETRRAPGEVPAAASSRAQTAAFVSFALASIRETG